MKHLPVFIYDSQGQFIGYGIKFADGDRLQTVNIWTDEQIDEFKQVLDGLNDENELRKFWPDAMDKEVVDLVEDPTWEPLELHEENVPNWAKSTLVYLRVPVFGFEFDSEAGPQIGLDDDGKPVFEGAVAPAKNPATGEVEWKDSEELDNNATHIVYEPKMVPDPQEVQNRYFKAQEIVARRRLEAFSR